MKRMILCFIVLLSIFSITGCGDNKSGENHREKDKSDRTPGEKNKSLNCSMTIDKNDGYKEKYRVKYEFIYDENVKDYKIESVYKELDIPKEINNVKDYYNIKKAANLDFEAELKDNTIIFYIDRDSRGWAGYDYSEYNYDDMKERLLDIGYIC